MTDRRDALKTIGATALAAGLDWPALLQKHMRMPRPTSDVSPAAAPAEPPPTPRFFTAHELRTLRVVADMIIPRDEKSGSATDAKAPEWIDFMLADPDASDTQRTNMRGALAWLDRECAHRYGKGFAAAGEDQRRAILDDIAFPKLARPEMKHGVTAFNRIRDSVASAFYSSQIGWKDLQYQGNVFNPNWHGCPEPALKKLGVSYEEFRASLATHRGQ